MANFEADMSYPRIHLPPKIKSPDWRAAAVIREYTQSRPLLDSASLYERMFYQCIGGDFSGDDKKPVIEAFRIATVPVAADLLRAFLFINSPIEAIMGSCDLDEDTVQAFACLFFDASVFPNRLMKMGYVNSINPTTPELVNYKKFLQYALNFGWEYLSWKTGNHLGLVNTEKLIKAVTMDSYWKGREAILTPITSKASAEAKGWVPIALKSAETLQRGFKENTSTADQLRIHLTHQDETESLAESDREEFLQ